MKKKEIQFPTAKQKKQILNERIRSQKQFDEFNTLCKSLRAWLKKYYPLRTHISIIIEKSGAMVVEPIMKHGFSDRNSVVKELKAQREFLAYEKRELERLKSSMFRRKK